MLRLVDETTSTNDLMKTWLTQGCEQGVAVLAKRQTQGRGRHGRAWSSEAGLGLYLSVGLRLRAPAVRLPWVALAVAPALLSVLTRCGAKDLGLKWPNDLLGGDRKLGGVLCESVAEAGTGALVVGVGINLRTPAGGWPDALRDHAVALDALGCDAAPDRESLAASLRVAVVEAAGWVEEGDTERIVQAWSPWDRSRGRRVVVEGPPRREGVAAGLSPRGGLWVELDEGTSVEVRAGEVRFASWGSPEPA